MSLLIKPSHISNLSQSDSCSWKFECKFQNHFLTQRPKPTGALKSGSSNSCYLDPGAVPGPSFLPPACLASLCFSVPPHFSLQNSFFCLSELVCLSVLKPGIKFFQNKRSGTLYLTQVKTKQNKPQNNSG